MGAPVRLLKDSWFLIEHHGANPGAIGEVVGYSGLNADDKALMVNWGDGKPVRCSLDELAST